MEEKHLLILLIIVLSFIVLMILFVLLRANKPETRTMVVRKSSGVPEKEKTTIEQLLEIAANRNSSKDELAKAIIKLAQELPFPQKVKGKIPKESKLYLNFVLLIASHRKADAKLVAFMNTELKKKNPEYSTEIDIYESEGIRQRGRRV